MAKEVVYLAIASDWYFFTSTAIDSIYKVVILVIGIASYERVAILLVSIAMIPPM